MKHVPLTKRMLGAGVAAAGLVLLISSHGAAIHDAIRSGDLPKVMSLLASNPEIASSPNTNDVIRELPIHIAAERGRTNMLACLLEKNALIDATNRWGQTALHRAIYGANQGGSAGELATVQMLLANGAKANIQDQTGQAALHYAAGGGHLAVAAALLDHGAQVDTGNGCDNGTPLIQATIHGQEQMIELLISRAADKEATGHDGATALSYAAYFGNIGAMRVLLSHGARIDAADTNGVTPLQYAVERGRTNAVELLLQQKANVDLEDAHGQTALGRCLAHNHEAFSSTIGALLRMYGAQRTGSGRWKSGIHEAAGLGKIEKVKELLQGDPALVNAKDSLFGETPLHSAARAGQVALAEFLLTAGARIEAEDSGGFTALHNAARSGGPAMIKLLLARKASPNAMDGWKRTPLHHAALGGSSAVVEILISAGAQPGAKDKDGLTALDVAQSLGNQGVIEALLKHQRHDAIRI